jgi:hypothetical protein
VKFQVPSDGKVRYGLVIRYLPGGISLGQLWGTMRDCPLT